MRVEVREWREEDAFALHQLSMHPYYSKKRIWRYLYPDTFLHSMATIHFYQHADEKRFLYRAVIYDGEVCGYIQCEKTRAGSGELSYWLGVEYWHYGIMQEAVEKACSLAFERLHLMSIYARVDEKNKASKQVLLHNGFQLDVSHQRFILFK